jgi:DNA-binding IclR family transcriptional regulator
VTTSTRTVDRALQLLSSVVDGRTATSLTELSRSVELSPSTASRLLATLAQHGLVRRDDDGAYRPGARLLQAGADALRGEPLHELAGPHLAALAQETGETANLGIRMDARRALYLLQVPSPQLVRTASWAGRSIPLRGTAIGAALRGRVGADGYASTRTTIEPDVTAVAAPIVADGDVAGALSVIAPTYRTSDADVARIGAALLAHAAELSAELGAGRLGAARPQAKPRGRAA